MKDYIRKFTKYVIIFIIIILIFNILLFLTSLFPSEIIRENVEESSKILNEEGNYWKVLENDNIYIDNYTDGLIINESYSIDNSNPVESYMKVRKNYKKDLTTKELPDFCGELFSIDENNEEKTDEDYDIVGELDYFLQGKVKTSITYSRYWHGYLCVIRPLLILFNIAQIRVIFSALLILLLFINTYLIYKKFPKRYAIYFFMTFVITRYIYVGFSLQNSPIFFCLMISTLIALLRIEKMKNTNMFFFIVGSIACYVDYLTVPLITLGVPLALIVAYKEKEEIDYKKKIKLILLSSVFWFIGYALTWISKWVIYDLIYKDNLILSAIQQVLYRSQRSNPKTKITIFNTIISFIINYTILIFMVLFIINSCRMVLTEKYNILVKKIKLKEILGNILIVIMPIVWYLVLANHTVFHTYFVYRHMIIFILESLFILDKIIDFDKITIKNKMEKNSKL